MSNAHSTDGMNAVPTMIRFVGTRCIVSIKIDYISAQTSENEESRASNHEKA